MNLQALTGHCTYVVAVTERVPPTGFQAPLSVATGNQHKLIIFNRTTRLNAEKCPPCVDPRNISNPSVLVAQPKTAGQFLARSNSNTCSSKAASDPLVDLVSNGPASNSNKTRTRSLDLYMGCEFSLA
ncbi:hypothetical protein RRG08_013628 [Elysia crispata]|uniref:Uncharacterized protein n=1 Tax=Elysia crispata TaxID=231223 RepID=A0AAE1DR50_9GAST|nr:hypothetical protein RRG08_013628 [Elysia crispata]